MQWTHGIAFDCPIDIIGWYSVLRIIHSLRLGLVPMSNTGHQVAPLEETWPPGYVTCIATLPWIALLALTVSIDLVSSSARVTSVKFAKGGSVCE